MLSRDREMSRDITNSPGRWPSREVMTRAAA
jgi:hypothetical protein